MTAPRPDDETRPDDSAEAAHATRTDRTGPVSLDDAAAVQRILADTVLGLWEVVGNLTRIRPARRERYRVTIFGSARLQPGSFAYDEVRRVAAALSELGCDIVTGGGPGLMQAANEGASLAAEPGRSVGIRVELPFEQDVNPFVEQAYEHRTFFSRLHHFVLASDCFVVAPGGIGTVLELTMIWQLLQVRHLHDVPLILVGRMWPELVDWARRHMTGSTPPLANAEDMAIPQCVPAADDAVALIREHHDRWLRQRDSAAR
jgi:uncharacterized protein (TIGR00730 family)